MILDLTAVVRDATKPAGTIAPLEPAAFPILWPRGEDGTLRLAVKKQDGAAFNLTGSALVFGLRRFSTDDTALISRQATITDAAAGKAEVSLVQADTITLLAGLVYSFDIQLTDATGKRWQVVPPSEFEIDEIFARPAEAVTVPPASSPLALGPSWLDIQLPEGQTDLTTVEQLPAGYEVARNFDDVTAALANLFARLAGIARVTGGTGTIRVRYGGTAGLPDGTLLLTMDPVTGLADAVVTKAVTAAKPSGTQLVKVTLQNSTAGQRTHFRGGGLSARGAA